MKPRMIIGFAAAALALAPAALAQKDPAEWRDNRRPELREQWTKIEGKAAPNLEKLEGWLGTEARSWKDLEGKVVLLDYWATWCGPCVAGIPHLIEMHEKYGEKGLVILAVHSRSGYEKMPEFVSERQLPYACVADPTGEVGTALGVKFLPSYFVIDRSGKVRIAGADRKHLDAMVEAVLAEPYKGAASESLGQWPAPVTKNLYANDWRGKKAPELLAAEWLTDKPKTEGKVVLIPEEASIGGIQIIGIGGMF